MGKMLRASIKTEAENANVESAPAANRESALKPDSLLHTSVTRRDFLKTTLGATGAIISWSLLEPSNVWAAAGKSRLLAHPHQPTQAPIPIIGGGLGGLVTAYRLHQQGIRCEIYEASPRLGGRVFTRSNFNADGMFVELGGELVDTGHEDLIALCEELRVPLEHFKQAELGIEPAIFYSQGQVYTEDQVLAAFAGLAKVLASDLNRCFPDGNVQVPTALQPANAAWLDQISLAEYLENQRDVAPEWLIRIIRSAYIGEYGLEPEEQSALNLALLIDTETDQGFRLFGESDETMRIKGGNSRLVDALIRAIKPHVPIHYGHRLTRLALGNSSAHGKNSSTNPSAKNQLRLGIKLGITVGSHFRWIDAPTAILALPFSVLRDVTGLNQLGLSAEKLRCIRELGYGTNSKQMIGFQSRFWRTAHPAIPANSGELFTDLPSQCYWETSRLQPGKSGILTNFMGGHAGKNAEPTQWKIVLEELKPLYGGDLAAQQDGHTAFLNWANYKWNRGSYSCPKPGQYTSLVGLAGQPELDGRLFFAGEHCSVNSAGYMNGAVESGNTAARQISEKFAQTAVSLKSVTLVQL